MWAPVYAEYNVCVMPQAVPRFWIAFEGGVQAVSQPPLLVVLHMHSVGRVTASYVSATCSFPDLSQPWLVAGVSAGEHTKHGNH
jgi:hypothetical protein